MSLKSWCCEELQCCSSYCVLTSYELFEQPSVWSFKVTPRHRQPPGPFPIIPLGKVPLISALIKDKFPLWSDDTQAELPPWQLIWGQSDLRRRLQTHCHMMTQQHCVQLHNSTTMYKYTTILHVLHDYTANTVRIHNYNCNNQSLWKYYKYCGLITCGRNTQIFYLGKSTRTTMWKILH